MEWYKNLLMQVSKAGGEGIGWTKWVTLNHLAKEKKHLPLNQEAENLFFVKNFT